MSTLWIWRCRRHGACPSLGAVLVAPALWLLPIAFPLVMALGDLLALMEIPIPGIEVGIALPAVVMGIMVMLEHKVERWRAAVIVSDFAIVHSWPHGSEAATGANALQYGMGFVIATGLLHVVGILVSEIRQWPEGQFLTTETGDPIAITGMYFLVMTVS